MKFTGSGLVSVIDPTQALSIFEISLSNILSEFIAGNCTNEVTIESQIVDKCKAQIEQDTEMRSSVFIEAAKNNQWVLLIVGIIIGLAICFCCYYSIKGKCSRCQKCRQHQHYDLNKAEERKGIIKQPKLRDFQPY